MRRHTVNSLRTDLSPGLCIQPSSTCVSMIFKIFQMERNDQSEVKWPMCLLFLFFALIGLTSQSTRLNPLPPGLSNHTVQWTGWILIPLWDENQQPQSQSALQLIISTGKTSPIWAESLKNTCKKKKSNTVCLNDDDNPTWSIPGAYTNVPANQSTGTLPQQLNYSASPS